MPIISIGEGQTATVTPADTLEYPSINSCLTLTAVVNGTAVRYGGHAVLIPEGTQLHLQNIYAFIQGHRATATALYVIGDLGTWNANWAQLGETAFLRARGINNVAAMATSLGIGQQVLFDTSQQLPISTYNIFFNANRTLQYQRTAGGPLNPLPGHANW